MVHKTSTTGARFQHAADVAVPKSRVGTLAYVAVVALELDVRLAPAP